MISHDLGGRADMNAPAGGVHTVLLRLMTPEPHSALPPQDRGRFGLRGRLRVRESPGSTTKHGSTTTFSASWNSCANAAARGQTDTNESPAGDPADCGGRQHQGPRRD